eukprot:TRINITY_DN23208_c0_g1_i1.p1 TRINITY_DN23208_c0_g1~~TRINITY_DN23208_c0_g1_i1.p1  ORF type:complete len:353 (+),score=36.60 TRINITY_DN23208_c0_g1_i1:24-1061(+)
MLRIVAAATALTPLLLMLPFADALELPESNVMTSFRESPDRFSTTWSPHVLLNGKQMGESRELFSDLGPFAHFSIFQAEMDFDGGGTATPFCRSNWWVSYLASALYLVFINVGPMMMKDRKAFDLKIPLALWNLFLAVFSFIGAVRTVPALLGALNNFGFTYTLCRAAAPYYGSGPVGLWVCVFIFSKYAELFDTFFLVVRKKNINFLHWYHHFSVLMYCWHAYTWEMPTGLYFVSMNYSVHAIMYFYYFLAGVMDKPPPWGIAVTVLQLLQMVVGIVVTCTHIRALVYKTVPNCDGHLPNLKAALTMYASYFLLFAHFFVKRYCGKRKASPNKKSAEKPSKKQQ